MSFKQYPKWNICTENSQFILLTAGVFLCFILNGYVNEAIFRIDGFSEFGFTLTFVQFVFYVFLSGCHLRFRSKRCLKSSSGPSLITLAIFNVIAMGLTNASVGYMNYPTQLMFKSCKVITVMAAGIALRGRKYKVSDYFAVSLMTMGLVFFTLADVTISPAFQTKGVAMVVGAVITDGVVAVYQEDLTQRCGIGLTELIYKTHSIGAVPLFAFLLITGEGREAATFCLQNWSSTFPLFTAFAVTGYIGILLVLKLIEKFGALSAVIVTTSRKAMTVALSFLLFNKPFTGQYVWSGVLILLGIYLNAHKTNIQQWLGFVKSMMCSRRLCKGWPRIVTAEGEWIV